jgi:hypothetical protein
VAPHGNILETLKDSSEKILDKDFTLGLNEILNEFYKIHKKNEFIF